MTQSGVQITQVGNVVDLSPIGNGVDITLYDVFTNRYLITQFQVGEDNEEVYHGDND